MKRLSFLLIITVALLCMISSANAFSLGGYTGPIQIKFNNWDCGTLYNQDGSVLSYATGNRSAELGYQEDGWGIMKITNIYAATNYGPNSGAVGSPLWSDGDGGEEITGIFWGINDVNMITNPPTWPNAEIQSQYGSFDFYLNTAGTFDPYQGSSGRTGVGDYTSITDTGDKFFEGNFVPGTFMGDLDPTNDYLTYDNNYNFGTNISAGSFYADINPVIGDYSGIFNTNAMIVNNDTTRPGYNPGFDDAGNAVPNVDFVAQFNGNPYVQQYTDDDWLLTSFDPLRGGAVPIPEPTTLLLLGFGLLGLAGASRKKSSK